MRRSATYGVLDVLLRGVAQGDVDLRCAGARGIRQQETYPQSAHDPLPSVGDHDTTLPQRSVAVARELDVAACT